MTEGPSKPGRGRRKLTKRLVDALKPGSSDYVVMDSEAIGFGVRVLPSGTRFFFAQYRLPGAGRSQQARRYKIGAVGTLTVENARAIAKRDVLGRVAAGHDPLYERKARNTDTTVRELADSFMADRRRRGMKETTAKEYQRLLDTAILTAFGARTLRTVQRSEVRALHERLAETPAVANNVVKILRAMFRFAEDTELWSGVNPCSRLAAYDVPSRKKSLKRDDYAALGNAFAAAERGQLPVPESLRTQKRGMARSRRAKLTGRTRGPYVRKADILRVVRASSSSVPALRFLALSGWRESEALSLRRDAVDFDRGVAILADSKTGRSVRPLGEDALDVLRAQTEVTGNPFVFPSELREGQHLQDAKRVWIGARAAAKLECRLHDLRHSFTTVGRELGYADYVIAKLVGHTVEGMTARYGDVPDQTVKGAADAIARTIAQRLAGKTAPVLSLTERRSQRA